MGDGGGTSIDSVCVDIEIVNAFDSVSMPGGGGGARDGDSGVLGGLSGSSKVWHPEDTEVGFDSRINGACTLFRL